MLRILSSIINFDGFRRCKAEWWRFAKSLFLVFGLAFAILISALEYVCWRTGETRSFTDAAAAQAGDPTVLWSARDSKEARFKLLRLAQQNPDVVVMGHSRVAQFRSAMFHPYRFYNMGRLTWNFDVYSDLLRRILKVSKPKVIIFSLDFTNFNPVNTEANLSNAPDFSGNRLRSHLQSLYDVYMILYTHPRVLLAGGTEPIDHLPAIGVLASFFSFGFRSDGSEKHSQPEMSSFGNDPGMKDSMPWNESPLFFGDKMGSRELSEFEEFAALARANGIQLIGVQMPMFGPAVRAMENSPQYGVLRDFRAHLAGGYFRRQGVIVFDYLNYPPYGDDCRYFLDRVHTGEVVSAAVLKDMWTSDSRVRALLPGLDIASLDRKIKEDQSAARHAELYGQEY